MKSQKQQQKCSYPNCSKHCYPGYPYCGKSHGRLHKQLLQSQHQQQQQSMTICHSQNFNSVTNTFSQLSRQPIQSVSVPFQHKKPQIFASQQLALPIQRVFPKDVVLLDKDCGYGENDINFIKSECSRFGVTVLHKVDINNDIEPRIMCYVTKNSKYNTFNAKYQFISCLENCCKKCIQKIVDEIRRIFKNTVEIIHFYNCNEPFYEFTNFYKRQIRLDNKSWPTSEHCFQAQKFEEQKIQEKIRRLRTPREAFDYAHKFIPKKNWNNDKIACMKKAVRTKFVQHEDLRDLLALTGKARLVEHTENDCFWGDGYGTGKNKLGQILEEVRHEIQETKGNISQPDSTSNSNNGSIKHSQAQEPAFLF